MSDSGIISVIVQAQLERLKAGLADSKSSIESFAGSLQTAGISSNRFNSATQEMEDHLQTAANFERELASASTGTTTAVVAQTAAITRGSAAYEGFVIVHEALQGRFSRMAGSTVILAQLMGGLTAALLGSILGIGGLIAALAYLDWRSMSAAERVDQLTNKIKFFTGLDLPTAQVREMADSIDTSFLGIADDADKMIGAFAEMKDSSGAELEGLTRLVTQFTTITGMSIKEAQSYLENAFNGSKVSAEEFASRLPGLTVAELQSAIAADKSGDAHKQQAVKLDLLRTTITNSKDAHTELNKVVSLSIDIISTLGLGLDATTIKQALLKEKTREATDEWNYNQLAVRAATFELQHYNDTAAQTIAKGIEAGKGFLPDVDKLDEVNQKITQIKEGMAAAQKSGQWTTLLDLNAKLFAAQDEAKKLKDTVAFGGQFEQAKRDVEDFTSTFVGSQNALRAGEINIWKNWLSGISATSAQGLEIQKNIDRLMAESARSSYSEQTAAAKKSARDQAAAAKGLIDSQAEAAQQMAHQAQQIEENNTATALTLAKIAFQDKKDLWQQEVDSHQITRQQMIENETAALSDQYNLEIAALSRDEDLHNDDVVRFAEDENKKLIIKAQIEQQMLALSAQYASAENTLARQQVDNWKRGFSEITGAESSLVSNILTSRQSLTQDLIQMSGQLLASEISNDLRGLTAKLMFNAQELAADKSLGQMGFLYTWLFGEKEVAAQGAVEAQKVAVKTAGAAQGMAIDVATGHASIANDAHEAFANTYAAVSKIPYIGPFIAPAAATVAYGAVMAYDTLTSLDVGAWNIPKPMMAMLHPGEQVIPEKYADGYRRNNSGEGVSGGDVNLHYYPTIHNGGREEMSGILDRGARDLHGWIQNERRNGALRLR